MTEKTIANIETLRRELNSISWLTGVMEKRYEAAKKDLADTKEQVTAEREVFEQEKVAFAHECEQTRAAFAEKDKEYEKLKEKEKDIISRTTELDEKRGQIDIASNDLEQKRKKMNEEQSGILKEITDKTNQDEEILNETKKKEDDIKKEYKKNSEVLKETSDERKKIETENRDAEINTMSMESAQKELNKSNKENVAILEEIRSTKDDMDQKEEELTDREVKLVVKEKDLNDIAKNQEGEKFEILRMRANLKEDKDRFIVQRKLDKK